MKLRKLKIDDAALMLEWMHDESVVKHLQTDFASKTLDDCKKFIASSVSDMEKFFGYFGIVVQDDTPEKILCQRQLFNATVEDKEIIKLTGELSLNFAIADDNDEYMGTVSLKHIYGKTAELGITIRTAAMGKGYSKAALEKIIKLGQKLFGMQTLYWCVDKENKRALRFYDKNDFPRMEPLTADIANTIRNMKTYSDDKIDDYVWFCKEVTDRTISVAIATYNGEIFIEKQLDTILNQTILPDEVIICDDCSSDATPEIIENYVKKYSMIKFIRNTENLGYIGNFKKAISLTSGKYIFLADQDDEWQRDKIETMIKIMDERNCAALCTNYNLIDRDSNFLPKEKYRINPFVEKVKQDECKKIKFGNLIYGNIVQGCTYCFSKEVKEKYLQLNSTSVVHDQQILFIASIIGNVLFYNHPLINYRLHGNNAIGFDEKSHNTIEIKKPSKKPFMVDFLNELNTVVKVPNISYYKFLYYLRIPYFVSKLR